MIVCISDSFIRIHMYVFVHNANRYIYTYYSMIVYNYTCTSMQSILRHFCSPHVDNTREVVDRHGLPLVTALFN